jgi:hypothetical protein
MINEEISNKRLNEIFTTVIKGYHDNTDQKSRHWEVWYNSISKFKNENNLINFRRQGNLSSGLDNSKDDFLFKFVFDLTYELGEEFVIKNLPKKNIGNSDYSYRLLGYYFDYNNLLHIHFFKDLCNYVFKENNIKHICEIGGGYGSLSRIILNNYNCKLISIDLPEANLMASYYLKENFKNKRFYLYDDYQKENTLSLKSFEENDIFILPPWVKFNERIKIDLFINTRSMMEMNVGVIKKYFNFIHNHIESDGFFLNINRYEKKTTGYKIRISEYPYDRNWKVVVSKQSYMQPRLHFLLTQRTKNDLKKNIIDELNIIDKLRKERLKRELKERIINCVSNRLIRITGKLLGSCPNWLINFMTFLDGNRKNTNS